MSHRTVRAFRRALAAGAVLGWSAPALAAGEVQFYPGDLGQAIAALAIFAALLLILGRYAWRPIVTQLRRREERIANALDGAAKREAKARELQEHYESRLEAIQAEAERILAKSREEAQALRQEALDAGRRDAEEYARRAKEDVESARQAALRELYETTADLATDVAGRLLRRSLGAQEHRQLVRESLEEIRARAARKSS